MHDGFIKACAASPRVHVADCAQNAQGIIEAAHAAANAGAKLLVTPELGITGYTCGDLFLQEALLADATEALVQVCRGTAALPLLLVAGLPLRHRGKLYNCAAVLCAGRVLGLVPKSQPANYSEFSELRYFSPAFAGVERFEQGPLRGVPIGVQMLFRCEEMPALTVGVEIGEDLWVPAPPSIFHVAAGATVIAGLAATPEAAGMAEKRRSLVTGQSGRLLCGYVYANAGCGESTTDLVFAGHGCIAENGALLAESIPFSGAAATSDIDLGRILHDRQRITSFPDAGAAGYILAGFQLPIEQTVLTREISPAPFIPPQGQLAARCEEILSIQAAGLQKRLEYTGCKTVVIGISGGLDSSLALLVAARAFAGMGRPAKDILAYSMPGFGTTARTRANAESLCKALGVSFAVIDITKTARAHFEEIAQSEDVHDVVYENAQARIRTLTLMDLANRHGGLVLGTGDLSELALGWATYNGDHMSMYGLNASVPKTLIRHLLAHEAEKSPHLAKILGDVLDTPVSPELLPAKDGEIAQKTEELVGPYELHDFFLYYMLRWGFAPGKVLRLACTAFAGKYEQDTILKWLKVFYQRFFSQQYKRSCLPDAPKVGSVSLSPRGGWCMPSDASAAAWMREVGNL
ncbi:NAD(+) synthase [Ruminococcaceae bacterium OttesenSCG-928-O06]|nr:NAD(+) synthase [Ruminococcaceae bacterium OttesenSCG-928-O06]